MRYWRDGREGMLSLGTYPVVGLADARKRRDEVRQQVAAGADPSAQRKEDKAQRAQQDQTQALEHAGLPVPGAFEYVAREWWQTIPVAKVSEGHAARTLIRLEQDI